MLSSIKNYDEISYIPNELLEKSNKQDTRKNKLKENHLQMLSINTRKGDLTNDFGLNAIKGRENEAQKFIDEAINFASITNTKFVHLMVGKGESFKESKNTFIKN